MYQFYAKINTETSEVIEFPYRKKHWTQEEIEHVDAWRQNRAEAFVPPADWVHVDVQTRFPETVDWKDKAVMGTCELVEGTWYANWTTELVLDTEEKRRQRIYQRHASHTQENKSEFEARVKALRQDYPAAEVETWPIQRAEAEAYTADNTASTPLLSAIATERGMLVATLAANIMERVAEYNAAYAALFAKYKANKAVLESIDLQDNTTWDNINNWILW